MKILLYIFISYAIPWSAFAGKIRSFVECYVFADWQYLIFLGVLIGINTLLEIIRGVKKSTFNYTYVGLFIGKLIIYACFLSLAHVVSHYTIAGKPNGFFSWFAPLAYSALIVRESISVLEIMGTLRPGLIPEWIMKKLRQYDRSGKFESEG